MQSGKSRASPDVSRVAAGFVCLTSVAACLGYAYYRDRLPDWWRGHGGGIPYVVFWITFWFMIFPFRRCLTFICLFATAFTCGLEFMQLWKPVWLTSFRSTRFGAALLGSGFDWNDFLPYFIGTVIGYIVLLAVLSRCGPQENGAAT